MANGLTFDFSKYDKKHLQQIAAMAGQIKSLFDELNQQACRVAANLNINDIDEDFDFFFGDFPAAQAQIDKLLDKFHDALEGKINTATAQAWALSDAKNDAMLQAYAQRAGLTKEMLKSLQKPNTDAMIAFQQRKTNGMNLSERVWNLTEQHKQELELALECGLADGVPSAKLSQTVRKYLNEPNKLFRRVRDKKTGTLRLSKAAKAYHPSRGVYRSSYKNAIRMTGTETNMAYRTADYDKWNKIDFVTGIEVHVSPTNHTLNGKPYTDICDTLAGTYPKEFKFVGWHPNCRCMAVPKIASREEFVDYKRAIMNGEEDGFKFKSAVTEMPDNFTGWVAENTERILSAKNLPYFIKDNYTGGNIEKGYKWLTKAEKAKTELTTLEKAAARHAARTDAQVAAIRQAAANRQTLKEFMFDDRFAEIRQMSKEWGIDNSQLETMFLKLDLQNMDNLKKLSHECSRVVDLVDAKKIYWEDFTDSINEIRDKLIGKKTEKAIALRNEIEELLKPNAQLKRTFKDDGELDKIIASFEKKYLDLRDMPAYIKESYTYSNEVAKTMRDLNDSIDKEEDKWFKAGGATPHTLNAVDKRGCNGFTYMNNDVQLTTSRTKNVVSAMDKIAHGIPEKISTFEADAMATYWHEITHNRQKDCLLYMTDTQTRYMEFANEFVARNTLPEFYKRLGVEKMPHPEFMRNRASTGYNGMVTSYQHVIDRCGIDVDVVVKELKYHLFEESYDNLKDGLIKSLMKANIKDKSGKLLPLGSVKKIVEFCKDNDFGGTKAVEKFLLDNGII